MSDISELERRITAAMDRIAKGVEQLGTRPEVEASAEVDALHSGASETGKEATGPGDTATAGGETGADLSGDSGSGSAELIQQLADEKMANAQLSERLKSLRTKLDKADAEAEMAAGDLRASLAEMDAALGQMKKTSEQLRQSNQLLRQANAEGLADGAAIEAGMSAELAALQAERQAEAAESLALAAALEPLLLTAKPSSEKASV